MMMMTRVMVVMIRVTHVVTCYSVEQFLYVVSCQKNLFRYETSTNILSLENVQQNENWYYET